MSLPETSDAFVGALAAALPGHAERFRSGDVDGYAWQSRLAARLPMDMPVFVGLRPDGTPCAGVALRRDGERDEPWGRMHLLPILKDLGLVGRSAPRPSRDPPDADKRAFAARFAKSLDYEAARVLAEANATDVDAYGWLAVEGPDRARRHGLARSYPWAVDAILESGTELWDDTDEDVACDLLRSSTLSGCGSEGTLRHVVRNARGLAFEGFDRREILDDLRALTFMPKAWIPAGGDDFVALAALAPHLLAYAAASGRPVAETMRPGEGGWAASLARLGRRVGAAHPGTGPRETAAAAARSVRDMTESFHRQVAWPAAVLVEPGMRSFPPRAPVRGDHRAQKGGVSRSAHRILLGGKSFPGAVDAATRWTGSLTVIANAVARTAAEAGIRWPSAFGDVRDRLGVRIACLADAGEMYREGLDLGHCVCAYLPRCLSGESVIASVRNAGPDGTVRERLSTVELRWDAEGNLYPVQHHGPRNGPPPDIAVLAVRRFAAGLRRGDVHVTRQDDPAGANETLLSLYADSYAPLRDAWAMHLPPTLAGAAPSALLSEGGVTPEILRQVVERMAGPSPAPPR